jgi:hypothetical protein
MSNETSTANTNTEEKINIIMGQTSYTIDEAQKHLLKHNNDELAVIRFYLTGSTKKPETSKAPISKNQLIYSEIRKFMDGCVKNK